MERKLDSLAKTQINNVTNHDSQEHIQETSTDDAI